MSAPEFQAKQGDSGSLVQQAITFGITVSLSGASYQFVYHNAEGELVVRAATLVSVTGSTGAATGATLKRLLSTADVSTPGYFKCEWRVVLADGSWLTRPLKPDDDENPNRSHQTLQVIESLYDGEAVETEDGVTFVASGFVIVDDLDELAALPFYAGYQLAKVFRDGNQIQADFEWDETIVTADAVENSVVPLTSPLGGGWRRVD